MGSFPTKTIIWHETAIETVRNMEKQVTLLGQYYGERSSEYLEAAQSLSRVLTSINIMGFGPRAVVTKDGPLSLFIRETDVYDNSIYVFGCIWHGKHRCCTADDDAENRCKAVCNDDGTIWSYTGQSTIIDHEHEWSHPLDAPTPGSWSLHS